jgi:hypothetical protein
MWSDESKSIPSLQLQVVENPRVLFVVLTIAEQLKAKEKMLSRIEELL